MRPWRWPKIDKIGLAYFVSPYPVSQQVTLSRFDFKLQRDTQGRRELVSRIYKRLLELELKYDEGIYDPGQNPKVQRIRNTREIMTDRRGNCLDLSIFFCGMCLNYGLEPILVRFNDHAMVAISLISKSNADSLLESYTAAFEDGILPRTALDTIVEMTNQVSEDPELDLPLYLPVECTGFATTEGLDENLPEGRGRTDQGYMSFERSVRAAREQFNDSSRTFYFALNIATLHSEGITPVEE